MSGDEFQADIGFHRGRLAAESQKATKVFSACHFYQ